VPLPCGQAAHKQTAGGIQKIERDQRRIADIRDDHRPIPVSCNLDDLRQIGNNPHAIEDGEWPVDEVGDCDDAPRNL